MATTTTMNPYRAHDTSVSVYQVPEFVVDGEKMLFHALYGNEAYEKLRKCFVKLCFNKRNLYHWIVTICLRSCSISTRFSLF